MGFNQWDVGCDCSCGGCTITVQGCNNLPLAGATVNAYDHSGGTLLSTATTDAAGHATLTGAGSSGYFEVLSGRFTTYTSATNPCGQTVTLSPATGYVCIPTCAQPLKTTIVVTYAGSAFTLTYGTYTVCGLGTVTGWFNGTAVNLSAAVVAPDGGHCNNSFGCSCVSGSTPAAIFAATDPTTGLAFTLVGWLSSCSGCALAINLVNATCFALGFFCGCMDVPATGVSVTCPAAFSASGTFAASHAGTCGFTSNTVPSPGGGGSFTASE